MHSAPVQWQAVLQLSNDSHTHPHSLFLTNTLSSTQAPTTFYSGDHNYLMTELLVSKPPFCTHDLNVNNLAQGDGKVGPLKQQVQPNSGGRTHSESFIIHPLFTHSSSAGLCAFIKLSCIHASGTMMSSWCHLAERKKLLGRTTLLLHSLLCQPPWKNSSEKLISAMKAPSPGRWAIYRTTFFQLSAFWSTSINVLCWVRDTMRSIQLLSILFKCFTIIGR